MDVFVRVLQPERYDLWKQGKDITVLDHMKPTPLTSPELEAWNETKNALKAKMLRRANRKRSQPRRHKTQDQKSLVDAMAMDTTLEEVGEKEDQRRVPNLDEEDKHKASDSKEDKMSAKRKRYSVEFKKGIEEDSRGRNLTAFCQEKKLDLRMVCKWRAEYDSLSQQVEEGNKCRSSRQPLFPELEVASAAGLRTGEQRLCLCAELTFALAVAPHLEISPEAFKASQHWLDGFLQRYELSLQKIDQAVQARRYGT
ncbi:hypothetical protein Chor_017277 [Crotalus horridus]